MGTRMLVVDDDLSLLNSFRRNLCFDYDLTVAASGPDALELMAEKGPFNVIMTDMRMPKMDGLELIDQARKLSPDSIYMMLTGNQDVATATRAVNDGQVFRFLTKPCEIDDIRKALEAATKQFELLNAERELLHKTFCGAVSAVIGVAEKADPRLQGMGVGVSAVAQTICQVVELEPRWEFKLASRIAPLGFALTEFPKFRCGDEGFDPVGHDAEIYQAAADAAAELLTSIPRLELVSDIIRRYPQETKPFCHLRPKTAGAIAQVGASLLRVALHTQFGLSHGMRGGEIVKELRRALPEVHEGVCKAIDEMTASLDIVRIPMTVAELVPGMVLAKDALSCDKSVMYRAGLRLLPEHLEQLNKHCGTDGNVVVTQTSWEAFVRTGRK
ncbi:MAG: hypothetical protein CMJ58_11080 [Planctomycetaceae bacterium]|nr:hypothetical protein [Planctomycetaceae bacterium]